MSVTPFPNRCAQSKNQDKTHCFHTFGTPLQNGTTGAAIFSSACCFCAPSWLHLTSIVQPMADDADIEKELKKHGPLISIVKQPMPGPRIATLGR